MQIYLAAPTSLKTAWWKPSSSLSVADDLGGAASVSGYSRIRLFRNRSMQMERLEELAILLKVTTYFAIERAW